LSLTPPVTLRWPVTRTPRDKILILCGFVCIPLAKPRAPIQTCNFLQLTGYRVGIKSVRLLKEAQDRARIFISCKGER